MSRFGVSILAVAATAFATLGVATSASAAGQISIASAGPTGTNPYVLSVTAGDGNGLQLTGMTVHVFAGATEVDTVTNMAWVSGPATAQVWRAKTAIPQADLPPGTYTLTVDATDTGETDAGPAAPAPFSFAWTTTVTGTAKPSLLTYNETTTTISGRVTGT